VAAKTPEYVKQINNQYDQTLKAQKKQLAAARDTTTSQYKAQIKEAAKSYDAMRKQAYTDNALAERARRESMANMGLSGAGGMSQTLAQRNRSALLGSLGDATRQQQDFTNNVNLALSNLSTQYDADYASALAQNAAERNAALLNYGQWQKSYDQNNDQWKKSYELDKANQNFSHAWELYAKRKITKDQFKNMTGIKLK
jgi:hypothetical protein